MKTQTGMTFSSDLVMSISSILHLMVSTILVVGCGHPLQTDSEIKIIGGDRVLKGDQIEGFTVSLVNPFGQSFCTGTLITKHHVLTAAHCLADYSGDKLFVAFGPVALLGEFKKTTLRSAKKFKIHEKFDPTQMRMHTPTTAPGDIAVVTMYDPAPQGYAPVPVMRENNKIRRGEDLVLAGYGLTDIKSREAGVLHKVTSTIKDLSKVAKEITFGNSSGKSACMGDSGGPALVNRIGGYALVGVTSRGSSLCDDSGIYTDVRFYIGWIIAAF